MVLILNIYTRNACRYLLQSGGGTIAQHAAGSATAGRSPSGGLFKEESFGHFVPSLCNPAQDALPLPHHGRGNHCKMAQGEGRLNNSQQSTY